MFFKPNDTLKFLEDVVRQLAPLVNELPHSIARCNQNKFTGKRHERLVELALGALRSVCVSATFRAVSDPEVFCMCFYCVNTCKCSELGIGSMFATDVFSSVEPTGRQNKTVWLVLKAIFSIDQKHASSTIHLLLNNMPEFVGKCMIVALIMRSSLGLALLKCNILEKDQLQRELIVDETTRRSIVETVDKLEKNDEDDAHHNLCDDWSILEHYVSHTLKTSMVVAQRKRTTFFLIVRIHTNDGLRLFAMRLNVVRVNFYKWSKQCSKELSYELQRVLTRKNLCISRPSKSSQKVIALQKNSEIWWDLQCLDANTYENIHWAQVARENRADAFLKVESPFTDFVSVSFVAIFV